MSHISISHMAISKYYIKASHVLGLFHMCVHMSWQKSHLVLIGGGNIKVGMEFPFFKEVLDHLLIFIA